ncbi:MAG: PIN domain-containing protein [Spirochaetes bacterium]|nr:PIN domain-containing protein [Spirochaetota bacterium]
MNYIVDTRYLLWSLVSPGHISGAHAAILEDPEHVKYVSTISFWEVSLKYALGKLSIEGAEPAALPAAAKRAGFDVLPISADDFATSYQLQSPGAHRDPFVRMLVWQCIRHGFTLLTADTELRQYRQVGLRVA